MLKLKLFKIQLLISFLTIIFLFSLSFISVYLFHNKQIEYIQYKHEIDLSELTFRKLLNQQQTFLLSDVKNEEYFRLQESENLNRNLAYTQILKKQLISLKNHNLSIENRYIFDSIEIILNKHKTTFDYTLNLILLKGFKDYGEIGKMRSFVHQLENEKSMNSYAIEILKLRRHEKDFLLRNDISYVAQHQLTIKNLTSRLLIDSTANKSNLKLLNKYNKCFARVVQLTDSIGINNQYGAQKELANYAKQYLLKINDISNKSELIIKKGVMC